MDLATGEVFETPSADKKLAEETVLRKLFVIIGKNILTAKADILEYSDYRQDAATLLKWL